MRLKSTQVPSSHQGLVWRLGPWVGWGRHSGSLRGADSRGPGQNLCSELLRPWWARCPSDTQSHGVFPSLSLELQTLGVCAGPAGSGGGTGLREASPSVWAQAVLTPSLWPC